jgi:holo-[acyl-carrier protein] synthase
MIQGIGVDIVDVSRLKAVMEAWGQNFTERIFTEKEIVYCQSMKNKYEHFAARFAAKEAVSKALEIGWRRGFRWKDVEIVNEPSGKPGVMLYNHMNKLLANSRVLLSLSHTETTVAAFAVIEKIEP